MDKQLHACHCCGLIQKASLPTPSHRAHCARCRTPINTGSDRNNSWTAALALAAIMLYPAAMLLPMLRVEQLGHVREDSLLAGVYALITEGYWFIGTIIFLFSVILPPVKLVALWLLSVDTNRVAKHHHARVYRAVEFLGKWSMLDVMVVALLVAFVKLGDLISIHAGQGLIAFAIMVLLSLVAGLAFNPHYLWKEHRT